MPRSRDASAAELLAAAVASTRGQVAGTGSPLLREEVYLRVRGWIVDGLLPPHTRLRDQDIAEALGVSRTPVREALRRLADERLVVAEASRWTKVTPVDVDEADRLYPLIWALERLAPTLAQPDAWDVPALRAANDRLAAALAAGDARAASDADTELHRLIVDAPRNPELSAIVSGLKLRIRRLEIVYFGGSVTAERSIAEHALIVDALEAGDAEAAAAAIEGNWRASLARLHERR